MVSDVVKANVKLMVSSEEGSMRRLAMMESRGGNASIRNGKICLGVNFWFESDIGKIIEFTNETDVKYSAGIFRLTIEENFLDLNNYVSNGKKKYPRIISYKILPKSLWGAQASAEAEVVIQESMKLYNQCCDALEHKGIFKW